MQLCPWLPQFAPALRQAKIRRKICVQPCRVLGHGIGMTEKPVQNGAKSAAQWREAPMFKEVSSKILCDGTKSIPLKQISHIRPRLTGQDSIAAIPVEYDPRIPTYFAVLLALM
jgi:hypothetical protein